MAASKGALPAGPGIVRLRQMGIEIVEGRDLLVRTLIGGRVSIEVGLLGTLVSGLFGVAWGATAGFAGGRWLHSTPPVAQLLRGTSTKLCASPGSCSWKTVAHERLS